MRRQSRVGLLVGAGSVGLRHLQAMATRYERLLVVDSNPMALERAKKLMARDLQTFTSLEGVASALAGHEKETTAVVANWGTHRFTTFSALREIGVTRVFLEKPVANSIAALNELAQFAATNELLIAVGHQRRYVGVIEHIRDSAMPLCGGECTHIVVHGGAKCMITQGLHWVDFAFGVFGEDALSVSASLTEDAINPRGSALSYWAGSAIWRFPRDRHLTISYSNQSSVAESVHVYGPTGRADITDDLDVITYVRDGGQVRADPRVTRVGDVGTEPAMKWSPTGGPSIVRQLDRLDFGLEPIFGIKEAILSTAATIASIIASEIGGNVQLPLGSNDPLVTTEWAFS